MTRGKERALRLALIGVLALSSCSFGASTHLAEEAVTEFHRLYNAESYQTIYSAADPAFRNTMTESDYVTFMSAIQRKLGPHKSSTSAGWRVSSGLNGTQVSLAYKSEFAAGTATEQFLYRISSGKSNLVGYNINSPLLIIK